MAAHFAGLCDATGDISVTNTSSVLSWHSLIEPTADWFVTVHELETCQNNQWITSGRIPLFPYNTGTKQVPDCKIRAQDAAMQDIESQFFHSNTMWVDDSMCATHHLCTACEKSRNNFLFMVFTSAHLAKYQVCKHKEQVCWLSFGWEGPTMNHGIGLHPTPLGIVDYRPYRVTASSFAIHVSHKQKRAGRSRTSPHIRAIPAPYVVCCNCSTSEQCFCFFTMLHFA
jgi:hypothetical protein